MAPVLMGFWFHLVGFLVAQRPGPPHRPKAMATASLDRAEDWPWTIRVALATAGKAIPIGACCCFC